MEHHDRGSFITVQTSDGGAMDVYVARPSTRPAPAVVLLQEIFGVTRFMREAADRFAEEGYVVYVPDLFWRTEPRLELSDQGADLQRAFELFTGFDWARGIADISDVVAHARADADVSGGVGVVGYCMGGSLSMVALTSLDVDCGVAYYPVQIDAHLDAIAGAGKPAVVHIAGEDEYCPPEVQAKIIEALAAPAEVEAYQYLGAPHPFANPYRAGFSKPATELAYSRTLAVLRRTLGPRLNLSDLWDQHLAHEFVSRDTAATMATMVAEPYVNHVPTLTGGVGFEELSRFYKYHFLDVNPSDIEMIPVSRTVGADRVVDEFVARFTHDREIPWMLPGIPPTGRRVEVALVAVVRFRGDKLCNEHIYWDQASVLKQLGLLDGLDLPVAGAESARKVLDESLPANELMPSWADSAGRPAP